MKNFVIVVEFKLRPGAKEQFMPLMLENAGASVRDEPGCRRFDVLTSPEDDDHVLLYEIYDDAAAFDAHLKTSHFLQFRESIKDLIEQQLVKKYELVNPSG